MQRKGVNHKINLPQKNYIRTGQLTSALLKFAHKIKKYEIKILDQMGFKERQSSVLKALIFGHRNELTKKSYTQYKDAGAMHLLAISGLHIGLLLLFLEFLFKPLHYILYGRLLKTIIIVCLLWSYGVIVGLTPSILRAVSMFTVFAVMRQIKRPTKSVNTLLTSIFILLILNPNYIYDIGFQLSYAAVFGIVLIYPLMNSKKIITNKIFLYFVNLIKVSIAAQLGLLPLLLYHFHQVPTLFLLTNLAALPLLSLILFIGFLMIPLMNITHIPEKIITIYGSLIDLMNGAITWVSQQEYAIIRNISLSFVQLIIGYLFIFSIVNFFRNKKYQNLILLLITVLFLQLSLLHKKWISNKKSIIVFHKHGQTFIGKKNQQNLLIYHDEKWKDQAFLKDYSIGENINSVHHKKIPSLINIGNKNLLVINRIGFYKIMSVKPEYVLLKDSPKINLERMIGLLKPKLIISDGSNYKYHEKKWQETCKALNIPFHTTRNMGALEIY